CPLNLAPMSSTTSTLVMGDALATVLIKARNFKPENFAVYHPGGSLGRRLLMKVKDVMHKDLPIVATDSDMDNVIMTMTKKRLGVVCIVENDILLGIITEGDIRRALKMKDKFFNLKAEDIMTTNYTYATEDIMALDALELMENRESQISVLPVLDGKKVVGVVRIHDLLNVVGK
ncbi:CBS domain-containing protein, partial [Cetobacterium sp.]